MSVGPMGHPDPWRPLDPRFPWIRQLYTSNEHVRVLLDTRTGVQTRVVGSRELAEYLAAHSAQPGYGGLGDLLRGLTKKLGFGSCEPCAERQAALNRQFPRVFRR